MKRSYIILTSIWLFITLSGFELYQNYRVHYSSGPNAGYSGDAASGFQTCASCHIGSPLRMLNSVITSDIPSTGYIPNATYTISVRIKENNLTRYGFQVSAQNANGSFLGQLVVVDPVKTQLNPDDEHYINHSYEGNEFPDGIGQWSFQWIAPDAGSGDVTFYGAFLLSNKSNTSEGDIVATSTLVATESLLTFLEDNTKLSEPVLLDIFPNPASGKLNYTVKLNKTTNLTVSILQSDGKVVRSFEIINLAPQVHKLSLPVSELPEGLYHLQLNTIEKKCTKSFLVN